MIRVDLNNDEEGQRKKPLPIIKTMNIGLYFRSVKTRLHVAYMADAYFGGFVECEPLSTIDRFMNTSEKERRQHPYKKMWGRIQGWYYARKMHELSENEIEERFQIWRSAGFKDISGEVRKGVDLMKAKKRWDHRLWTRYETKRSGRRLAAKKWAWITRLTLGLYPKVSFSG